MRNGLAPANALDKCPNLASFNPEADRRRWKGLAATKACRGEAGTRLP